VNGSLQVLRLEVRSDAQAFAARVDELAGLSVSPASNDPNLLARAAVALHHAYGAFESALARIAKVFDTEPSGANWHRSLLETMAMEVPGLRPAVVGQQTLPPMRDLLAFRHFFRHAYSVPLDAGRLSTLRERAIRVRPAAVADFAAVDAWLAKLADRV
jgi:hypothetical protein